MHAYIRSSYFNMLSTRHQDRVFQGTSICYQRGIKSVSSRYFHMLSTWHQERLPRYFNMLSTWQEGCGPKSVNIPSQPTPPHIYIYINKLKKKKYINRINHENHTKRTGHRPRRWQLPNQGLPRIAAWQLPQISQKTLCKGAVST